MFAKGKIILVTSVSLNLIFLLLCGGYIIKSGGISFISTKIQSVFNEEEFLTVEPLPYYVDRVNIFDSLPIQKDDTVFIGDSMIDRGEWQEYFPNEIIKNRGINDETTEGVLKRLKSSVNGSPKRVFIMVGLNDLKYQIENQDTAENFEKMIRVIRKESPDTEIFIHSILPTNPELDIEKRNGEDILKLNSNIEKIAIEQNVTYIDLHSLFNKNDVLNEKYTTDGVHLNGSGYEVWALELQKYVSK